MRESTGVPANESGDGWGRASGLRRRGGSRDESSVGVKQETAGRQRLQSARHPRHRPAGGAVEVTGETVLARRETVVATCGGGEVMLALVVDHDYGIAVRVVDAMQRRAERGDAQCQQQQLRRSAHQLRRQPQQVPHHCESNGHPRVAVKSAAPLPQKR